MRTMNLEPGDVDTQGDTATHTVSGTEGKDDNDDAEVDDGPTNIEAHVELAKTPRKCSSTCFCQTANIV
jgi:hypothetical protein